MTDTELRALLEDLFPIESYYFALAWAPEAQYERPPSADPDDVYVVLRLICWFLDEDGETKIRDVREQPVLLVPAKHRQDPRLEAWLHGLRDALLQVMQSQDPSVDRNDREAIYSDNALACMLPFHLVQADVLQLTRTRTAEDFTQVLLGTKGRLGRMLFPPRAS